MREGGGEGLREEYRNGEELSPSSPSFVHFTAASLSLGSNREGFAFSSSFGLTVAFKSSSDIGRTFL